ncbi:MAG: hypothetical protein WBD47_13630 [Phormidesmis sp.]
MSDRLDQIEAILATTAQQQAQNTETLKAVSEQQAKNTEGIDTLLGAIATTEARVQNLTDHAEESNQRFEVLRSEAQADREETQRLWNDAVTQMEADRAESRQKFDETLGRIDAQQEVIQRLLVELISTNRDATQLRDRVDGLEAS